MRSIGDLMKDMGFNADAPVETQKAFIRHLISAANSVAQSPLPNRSTTAKQVDSQLSFDPDVLGMHLKKTTER